MTAFEPLFSHEWVLGVAVVSAALVLVWHVSRWRAERAAAWSVLDALSGAYVVLDHHGRALRTNAGFEQLSLLSATAILGEGFCQHLRGDSAELLRKQIRQTLDGRTDAFVVWLGPDTDHAQPMRVCLRRLAGRGIRGLVLMHCEAPGISSCDEQMSTFVQNLIDVIPEPVYVKDDAGRFQIVNEAFVREYGVTHHDVIGVETAALPKVLGDAALILQEDRQVLAGSKLYKEEQVRSEVSGADVYRIVAKARCLDAAGRVVIVGTHFNVSLWREAEHRAMKALALQRRTHDFLQSVFDSLPNPIFVVNNQLQHLMVNQAFLSGLNVQRADVEGHRPEHFMPREFIEQLQHDELWFRNAADGDVHEGMLALTNQAGQRVWLIVRQVCCRSVEGERIFVGAVSDITHLREAEMRWFDAKEVAERANAAKSEFVANISHELRTPMHGILSFARLGQERALTETPERLVSYFDRIAISGERLMGLLDALLDISKLEEGVVTASLAPVDMRQLLEEGLQEYEALLVARQIRVLRHGGEVPMAMGDAALLSRMIRNLLSNAIKFSAAQGVVDLYYSAYSGSQPGVPMFELIVADRGPGIPENELDLIFEKFVQSSATRSGAGGTGLGLAICRQIVGLHRGQIFARARTGGGAEFVVRLPVAEPT